MKTYNATGDNGTAVTRDRYTKPIRFYCDVDGVFNKFYKTKLEEATYPYKEKVLLEVRQAWSPSDLNKEITVEWIPGVPEKLASLSKNPLIDFVWLTSWRSAAPIILDDYFGIDSIGYLPWQEKFSDHSGSFKRVALVEDLKGTNAKVIWIDDVLATKDNSDRLEKIVGHDNLLTIQPDMFTGLTNKHFNIIDNTIERWS